MLVEAAAEDDLYIRLFQRAQAGKQCSGYLLWSGLIPYYGLERGKTIAEWLVWIPFGGATIVALWWLAGLVAWQMVRRERA